ncbi:MAG: prepilin peptidase [Thermoanaerobaculia bacterium]
MNSIGDLASAIAALPGRDASLALAQFSILNSQFTDLPYPFLAAAAFVLGALVGSFLNVVIHRFPLGESIVFPASRCGSCRAKIKPWDNLPIVSWLLLRGRCRACGAGFSSRYMLVELANALFYLALFVRMGVSPGFLLVAAIVSMTIVLIFIDLDIQILPDVVDLPGIAIGIAIGALHLGQLYPAMFLSSGWLESLIGAFVGGSLIFSVNLLYKAWRGIDGMGMGDAKMLAMIGAVMGWKAVLPVLFLASMVGAVFGIAFAMRSPAGMQTALPFGVFLGLASILLLFFGYPAAALYWSAGPG